MKLNPQNRNISQEKGISFLEILVVLAILGVTASLVMPNIGSWRNKSLIEADVEALVSQIEYIKARVALINGTGVLICSDIWDGPRTEPGGGFGNRLIYQISSYRQTSDTVLDPNTLLATNIVEDGSAKNILSGKTVIQGGICGRTAIFLSNGRHFLNFSGGYIDINITFLDQSWSSAWLALSTGSNKYPFYNIRVEPMTSFVTKFKSSPSGWIEIE
ncbi:pilus assembly FimT family protein [Candidatus Methylopumilus universalis]|jgi:type II secretory pathway pseudopilin PulG|uniref:pilus assembly FimT family protein n=1 Tax=Candidatus Methylopumilus universalis TaxID=2588536 RepID=UPI003BEF4042